MIPRIFDGQDAVVVAGGPSLRGYDLGAMLAGRNVIAINRAHEVIPDAPVLWWTDARFWRRAKTSLLAHSAPWKATCDEEYRRGELPPEVHQYKFSGTDGFDPNPARLRHGWNSAYTATHLAMHLGARKIIWLGVDLYHDGTPSGRNFHSGYGEPQHENVPPPETESLTRWKQAFYGLFAILEYRGVKIVNGSPNSALRWWPRCTPEDALSS